MHKILVITLYFPLDVLHVSDCISPSSGATLYAVHRIWYMSIHVWYWHIPACTAYKVAPDDGLIQSETCRAFNGK